MLAHYRAQATHTGQALPEPPSPVHSPAQRHHQLRDSFGAAELAGWNATQSAGVDSVEQGSLAAGQDTAGAPGDPSPGPQREAQGQVAVFRAWKKAKDVNPAAELPICAFQAQFSQDSSRCHQWPELQRVSSHAERIRDKEPGTLSGVSEATAVPAVLEQVTSSAERFKGGKGPDTGIPFLAHGAWK